MGITKEPKSIIVTAEVTSVPRMTISLNDANLTNLCYLQDGGIASRDLTFIFDRELEQLTVRKPDVRVATDFQISLQL